MEISAEEISAFAVLYPHDVRRSPQPLKGRIVRESVTRKSTLSTTSAGRKTCRRNAIAWLWVVALALLRLVPDSGCHQTCRAL
jgi:hypothetical protein